jgi:hypothetical protein
MMAIQTADESGNTQEHDARARGWRWLPEMYRSDFEKIRTKNFRKRAKGADSWMRAVVDAVDRWIYREGVINVVIETKNNKTRT